ncbi:E1-E2 ATPase-domain-containing protein [Massariosphaeria phaeospora]|uniref:E1-E2 ATPase-domain-containing protein n=1 Tax=Massariosphaeria phaeospora TaxID=100035 RepID=A0A7C8ICV0_9PLEO|nr:E1-E2 ATPase-domain-containing protein [Massariosphaeria phaeospora]
MHKQQTHIDRCDQCKAEAGEIQLETDGEKESPLKQNPVPVISTTEGDSLECLTLDGASSPTQSTFISVEPLTTTLYQVILGISGMTCSACVGSITRAVQQLPWVRSIDVNLLTNSGTAVFEGKDRVGDIVERVEDAGFDATVVKLVEVRPTAIPNQQPERWKATYAIGGLTCSACVGNVTNALAPHSWIDKVDVNLVGNSATILFRGKEHLREIQESIEDSGYDATLDSVVAEGATQGLHTDRSVSIRIDGMFCPHCPQRVVAQLDQEFGTKPSFGIEDPPLSLKTPILNIRYVPEPPNFTIRNVFDAITELSPEFRPSVYHPPTLEERAREMHILERRRILFRLVLCVIIAIPTFILGIVFMSLIKSTNPIRAYVMQPMWAGNATRLSWALFILATPIYFFAADTFHRRAIKELRAMWRPGSRTPFLQRFFRFGSMNMLMSLGTTIAYLASVVELALAATKKSSGAMSDSYFDAVVFLTMFLLIGRFLEAYSKAKTGDAVTSLGKLRPDEATLVDPQEGDLKIATDLLDIHDIVRVHHGTSPPFDGVVMEGNTSFDESSLTGESRPVKKEAGDTVFSGTVNKGQPIKIQITTVSGTSMLDQIINAVREGQTRRAPVERVADTITSHFVPFVVMVAVVTWLIWLTLGVTGAIPKDWKKEDGSGGWVFWSLRFAIAVFVIACPCGIGLAAPTALFVGGGLAAKHGILVRGGGEAFQEASSLDCIVFDKTGTLTQGGDPAVTNYRFPSSRPHSRVLGILKTMEEHSNHPIARALVSFCNNQSHDTPVAVNVDEVPGKGLKGTFRAGDEEIIAIIGNESYMADHHVVVSTSEASTLQSWKAQGHSVALAAIQQQSSSAIDPVSTWELAATFAIADPLRPEAIGVIKALRKRNINVWMLSGDNSITANAVGAQLGIPTTNIIAGVLPDQKAEKIKYLQQTLVKDQKSTLFRIPCLPNRNKPKRAIVAMVGDGINDAPALSTADLSIAIGSGSDIALSSSSFILINSHLGALLTLLDLSRVVFRRVYFNFGWALVYNMVAMPIAAGVLFPITVGTAKPMNMHHDGVGMEGGMAMGESGVTHIRLDPVWASLAMALSSVSVVCSSLALRSKIPGLGFRARKTTGEGQ